MQYASLLITAAAAVLQSGAVMAADYPAKPIRMIVPVAPGGGSDQMGRLLGQKFTEAWGQPVVVDNRAGAGQTIGADMAAKAVPDGHTLVVVNPSHAITATLMTALPYDAVRDFAAVTVLATQPYAVVVYPALPVRNIRELIALAKSKPGEVTYASAGLGSASHLATEMFIGMTGIAMTHVPFKGTGPAIPELISGRVAIMINPILAVAGQVKAGRLHVLAVTAMKRSSSLPDVPTVAEAGVPGYEALAWYLLLAPAKTPGPIVAKISAEAIKAVQAKDARDMLSRSGTDALGTTPREATEFLRNEVARWGRVIKQAGVKAE
jgi:tripartite-type tricarboxylate transporter receptor subunit TctC